MLNEEARGTTPAARASVRMRLAVALSAPCAAADTAAFTIASLRSTSGGIPSYVATASRHRPASERATTADV